MTDIAFETLLSRLERAPDNVMVRLAVIRRAVDLSLGSRALDLAFDLTPEHVSNDDDRRLVAGVFATAELSDDAADWGGEVSEAKDAKAPEPTPVIAVDTAFGQI